MLDGFVIGDVILIIRLRWVGWGFLDFCILKMCQGLNGYVFLSLCVDGLILSMVVFGDGAFKEVRVNEVMRMEF